MDIVFSTKKYYGYFESTMDIFGKPVFFRQTTMDMKYYGYHFFGKSTMDISIHRDLISKIMCSEWGSAEPPQGVGGWSPDLSHLGTATGFGKIVRCWI